MIDEIAEECGACMLKLMQNPESELELGALEGRIKNLEDASKALEYI